jgi:hypothetical protein
LNSELDFNRVPPSNIVEIHEAMGESLKISIGDIENTNSILKIKL